MTDKLFDFKPPFYLYDFDKVSSNLDRLSRHYGCLSPTFFYSVKTNDHPALLKFLKDRGLYVEVASGLELTLARKIGFKKIVFNGPAKTFAELTAALEQDDVILMVDNLQELEMVRALLSKRREIGLRINLFGTGLSKLGFSFENLRFALELISGDKYLSLAGLHFNAGTMISSARIYEEPLAQLTSVIRKFVLRMSDIRFIDIGGGIPCQGKIRRFFGDRFIMPFSFKYSFMEEYLRARETGYFQTAERAMLEDWMRSHVAMLGRAKDRWENMLGKKLEIYVEPGTSVIGDAVDIHASVAAKKSKKVLIDVGAYIEYGYGNFWHPVYNLSDPSSDIQRESVCGPSPVPYDVFALCYKGRLLKKGDRVKIASMGAYTFSYHVSFGRPQLAVVLKNGQKTEMTNDAESLEDKYGRFL
jgi:diaminopimelate decarboxylase